MRLIGVGMTQQGGAVSFDADLVLEGGGVKGIGLVGAYCALKETGYRFHRIAGTSAGSIMWALAAADMPTDELIQQMRTVDYLKFEDEFTVTKAVRPRVRRVQGS
jgi:NTE family protein